MGSAAMKRENFAAYYYVHSSFGCKARWKQTSVSKHGEQAGNIKNGTITLHARLPLPTLNKLFGKKVEFYR